MVFTQNIVLDTIADVCASYSTLIPYLKRALVSMATCHGTSPALRLLPFTILEPLPTPDFEVPVRPQDLHTKALVKRCG